MKKCHMRSRSHSPSMMRNCGSKPRTDCEETKEMMCPTKTTMCPTTNMTMCPKTMRSNYHSTNMNCPTTNMGMGMSGDCTMKPMTTCPMMGMKMETECPMKKMMCPTTTTDSTC